MVKKRKPTPITFPRVKVEMKSDDKDIPGIDDARDRLKGALQELLDQSDDSSLSSSDDGQVDVEPIRVTPIKKERTSAPSTPRMTKNLKRRRRRETVTNVFHHTFVMKLFDRSVDLAQFEENSPLYAVCRGWMANQPRNTAFTPKKQRQQPAVLPERPENNMKDETRSDEADAVEDVWEMPKPVPLPTNKEGLRKFRIPSPVPHEKTELASSENGDGKAVPSREALLNDHLKHWTKVNRKWRTIAQNNEQRYKTSIQMLKNIYKRSL